MLSLLARRTPEKENNKDVGKCNVSLPDAGPQNSPAEESSENADVKGSTGRPIFPFFIPPFRGIYNQGSLQASNQFDVLRNSNLMPNYSGLARSGQFPPLHPFALRGFPVHPSLLRQVNIANKNIFSRIIEIFSDR